MGTTTIIDSEKGKLFPDFRELFRYRDLFLTLTWRDFRVRYAQTTIGFLWAFIQPVATLAILTLVFNKVVGVETEIPHIVFTACGLSLWAYFSYVLTNSGSSIIQSQDMIKKIYFPRLIVPLSKALVGFIDFGIALLILIVLMIYFKVPVSGNFWCAPLFLIAAVMAALAVGIWLSALTVRFRDFQHIVPFMVQIGLYASPVAYRIEQVTDHVPPWAQVLYYLNPMAGIVQGFRWSLFGGETPGNLMYISIGVTVLLFITGLMYFKRVQDQMADFV